MTVLQQIYGETVHSEFPAYFANWPPNQPVSLGTLGILQTYTFQAVDSLTAHDPVSIHSQSGTNPGLFRFSTASELSIEAAAEARTPGLDAGAHAVFKFAKRGGLFFCAAGAQSSLISNQTELHAAMLRLFHYDLWNPDWVVVVGTLSAGAFTLLISNAAKAEMHLKANVDLQAIDFADASIAGQLKTQYERDMAFQWVAERGMTPLLRLARIRRKFLGGLQVQTNFAASDGPAREAQAKLLREQRDRVLAAGGSVQDEFEVCEISQLDLTRDA